MNIVARRPSVIVAVLLGALALALLPAIPGHAAGPGTIAVSVTADGSPSASVFVRLEGPDPGFAVTDSGGAALFSDRALGEYTVVVQASGPFQDTTATVTLTESAPTWTGTVAREPWPTGEASVALTVVDHATGVPVAGIHVTLSRTDAAGARIDGVTDADGVFHADDLVAGEYVLGTDATPDHLGAAVWITLADGQSMMRTLRVLAADSTIQGRVIDPDGAGVPGLWVSALMDGPDFFGSISGFTDADGYYSLEDAAAGIWRVGVNPDSSWERATVDVEVAAATTATAIDLELAPRFTGTISGLVASADGLAESTEGGFFDVCVSVLHADGTPVADASLTTGGDSFYYFWLAPGDYTAYFEDCDPDREPHGYQPVYLGGSPTLAGATVVTVETLVDTWLDTTTLEPVLTPSPPPHEATAVRTRDLAAADRDLIDAPSMLRRGESASVVVGAEHAGEWVSVWLHSRPTQLGGWQQVSATGTVQIEVPRTHPLGVHELVVQDADDEVIGWTDVRVRTWITCLFPWLPDCS